MKNQFAELLFKEMAADVRIRVVTADAGYGVLDDVRQHHSTKFYNVGHTTRLMTGIAVGLAQANLVPVCYSDNEYMIAGAFDLLKAYAENEKLAVKLVCGHHTEKELVCMLPHIDVYVPNTIEELDSMWPEFTTSPRPAYLSLRRIV